MKFEPHTDEITTTTTVYGRRLVENGHRFLCYGIDRSIDWFAGLSEGYHNGPLCVDCGASGCHHCEAIAGERCPKA